MHGCFWHQHEGCKLARVPKSRISFWEEKLKANRLRDIENQRRLAELGWRVLVVWECELSDLEGTAMKVREFLNEKQGRHDAGS